MDDRISRVTAVRSIVQDKSNLFFKMLERDRGEWWNHWLFYTRTFKDVFDAYRRRFQLDTDAERELVLGFTRPELDRLKQRWEEKSGEIKLETLKRLTAKDVKLRLERSQFVVYFMGGLGLEPVSELLVGEEHVFFTDLLALYRLERLDEIPDAVFSVLRK